MRRFTLVLAAMAMLAVALAGFPGEALASNIVDEDSNVQHQVVTLDAVTLQQSLGVVVLTAGPMAVVSDISSLWMLEHPERPTANAPPPAEQAQNNLNFAMRSTVLLSVAEYYTNFDGLSMQLVTEMGILNFDDTRIAATLPNIMRRALVGSGTERYLLA